ncbi:TPA: glycosyltransferase [Raoultella ornithinolytica]|nr:glycosyltransferase [Raoultella ornithinolytica]
MKNKVTVYIPTHNRVELLKIAVESIINQTYKNIQIVICDDASSDGTQNYVNDLISQCNNTEIIYLRNESSKGACFSRNRCIEVSDGDFITGLDDDDYFLPCRIEEFIECHTQTRSPMVSSSILFKKGSKLNRWHEVCGEINNKMLKKSNVIGNQIFALAEIYKELGGFDTSFQSWQDYELWYRMTSSYGTCLKLKKPTYVMNVDIDRPRITTSGKAHIGYLQFIQKHGHELNSNELKSLYFRDKINRHDKINFDDLINYFSFGNLKLYIINELKHQLRKNAS